MDSIFEKRAQNSKSEEEIQRLLGPENQNFIDRSVFLLVNGQPFQKLFVCSHIKKAKGMDYCVGELLSIFKDRIPLEPDNIAKEMLLALAELVPLIKVKQEHLVAFTEICLNILSLQPNNYPLIDASSELLKVIILLNPIDTAIFADTLFMETDNQMYEILKIIEVFYAKFPSDFKRQAIVQIKSSIKHKDERVRKYVSEMILKDEILQTDLIKEFDWIDKLTNLIYDPSKDVRKSAATLFLDIYKRVQQDIQLQRFQMLLQNIIQSFDGSHFDLCDRITQFIADNEETQKLFAEKLKQSVNDLDAKLLYLQRLPNFYANILAFQCEDVRKQIDDHIVSVVSCLCAEQRNCAFLEHVIAILPVVGFDTHYNLLNEIFSNFELNQLAYIPYLEELVTKSSRVSKNKNWLGVLQKVYDLYKRSLFQYEGKGLWYELEALVSVLALIAKTLGTQKDYWQVCLKMLSMGSSFVRKKVTWYLVEQLPEMDSLEQREQVVQQYLQLINSNNYQSRLLVLEFCQQVCKKRSRKFFVSCNILNAISLQFDPVASVRVKLAQLLYQIRLLLWNEEKETILRVTQVLHMLTQDKKSLVAQVSRELVAQLQKEYFNDPERILLQGQVNQQREMAEMANLKMMQNQQSAKQIPKMKTEVKADNSRLRNQTPTGKGQAMLPPIQKRTNNMLVPPGRTQQRKSVGKVYSKSPMK